jgi:hypothetical protein
MEQKTVIRSNFVVEETSFSMYIHGKMRFSGDLMRKSQQSATARTPYR